MTRPPLSEPSCRVRWLTLTAALVGWMFDGLEMGIFPLVARPALQELLRVQGDQMVGVWMGRITAAFLVGAALGGVAFGWLGDRVGRVRAMSLSVLTYSVFTGICYFTTSPWQFAGYRFIAALGMGGEWSLGVALVMETWPGKSRPVLAGVIGAANNVGSALVALLALAVPVTLHSWRWIMAVGAAPALLAFFLQRLVPESERWKEVVKVTVVRPLREVSRPPLLGLVLLAITFASVALIGTWGSVQWIPLWVDRLTGGAAPDAKAIAQILRSAGAICGCLAGALVAGSIGRRPAYFLLCAFSLASCAVLFRLTGGYGLSCQIMIFFVGVTTASFYGWLPLYLPELFPTRVRATAQGISFNFGRVFAAAGALGSGQLVGYYHGDYGRMGASITLIYLVGMAAIWLAPETKGAALPT